MTVSGKVRTVRARVAFVVVAPLAFMPLFLLYVKWFPAVTADGHPVMPTGQGLCALLGSGLLGVVAAYLFGRSPR